MNVAVLMTCHNRRETTLRCLRALADAVKEVEDEVERRGGGGQWSLHVFLVDDGSTDGTCEEIVRLFDCSIVRLKERSDCPVGGLEDCAAEGRMANLKVRVIKGDGSLFWAKGMELAWREALKHEMALRSTTTTTTTTFNYDSFLWLNDDVELDATAIETVLASHLQHPSAVIVGAMREAVTGKKVYGIMDSGLMTGNFVWVPRIVYDKVGMICGDYHHAWADCDYALRCRRENIEVREVGPVGTCSWHEFRPRLDGRGIVWRLRTLFDPKGWCVHDVWLFRRRHSGTIRAMVSSVNLIQHVLLSGWNYWLPLRWVACRMPRAVQRNLWRGLRVTHLDQLLNDEGYYTLQLLGCAGERYCGMTGDGGINSVILWQRLRWNSLVPKLCSDKLEVRRYVAAHGLESILNELYSPETGWTSADDIDFDVLPECFVLKCSQGSGMNLIVRDKGSLDQRQIRALLEQWLRTDFASRCRERQYGWFKPRILCERLIEAESGVVPMDYKFMCTDGMVLFCRVDEGRFGKHKRACYSRSGEKLDVQVGYEGEDYPVSEAPVPENWQAMVDVAEKLSKGIPLVRVDLYSVSGKVVFGEMTFTSGGGFEGIRPFSFSQAMARQVRVSKE